MTTAPLFPDLPPPDAHVKQRAAAPAYVSRSPRMRAAQHWSRELVRTRDAALKSELYLKMIAAITGKGVV